MLIITTKAKPCEVRIFQKRLDCEYDTEKALICFNFSLDVTAKAVMVLNRLVSRRL
jgi:hypothetical protein